MRPILSDPSANVIEVEHRDGLICCCGVEALAAQSRQVAAAGAGESVGSLVRDMAGALTWVCARCCGRGGAGSAAVRGHGGWVRR
jgi:predicted site-specific integrase-resolvase